MWTEVGETVAFCVSWSSVLAPRQEQNSIRAALAPPGPWALLVGLDPPDLPLSSPLPTPSCPHPHPRVEGMGPALLASLGSSCPGARRGSVMGGSAAAGFQASRHLERQGETPGRPPGRFTRVPASEEQHRGGRTDPKGSCGSSLSPALA